MIIGINGFKGSGKDTAGGYLWNKHKILPQSFAYRLKKSAAALFNINPHDWETYKNDDNIFVMLGKNMGPTSEAMNISNMSARVFLQRYGTEAHREVFGTDFWVMEAIAPLDLAKSYSFTDARFKNELEAIKSLGGYNLQILRKKTDASDGHASEVRPPIHLIDYQIHNDGTIEEFYEKLEEFMEFLHEVEKA